MPHADRHSGKNGFAMLSHTQALLWMVNQADYMRAVAGDPKSWHTCAAYFMCGTPLETDARASGLTQNLDKARQLMKEAGYDGRPIVLLFLGAGTPPEVSSWGNIMAEGRTYVRIACWILLFPGMCLATTVQAINLIGDGLRDTLDPQLARRMCTIPELALSTPWLGIRILKAAVRRQASHPSA